ncbi:hypothetical protein BDN72DRAFT_850839 [Pluteus cervinus]|uniref:Uncharacterized protein n=1 Tax=Pluteus cervinus TaxID=181527 RepID=A0ACD3A3P4_9AGAR|nr:hypothetical protein BDN72DRAFT_850839 [Pluteus cervinus]
MVTRNYDEPRALLSFRIQNTNSRMEYLPGLRQTAATKGRVETAINVSPTYFDFSSFFGIHHVACMLSFIFYVLFLHDDTAMSR